MDHDPDRLHQLGSELKRLRARIKTIKAQIESRWKRVASR
jgi:peptidoglycan hydrolase CwlO-like protein